MFSTIPPSVLYAPQYSDELGTPKGDPSDESDDSIEIIRQSSDEYYEGNSNTQKPSVLSSIQETDKKSPQKIPKKPTITRSDSRYECLDTVRADGINSIPVPNRRQYPDTTRTSDVSYRIPPGRVTFSDYNDPTPSFNASFNGKNSMDQNTLPFYGSKFWSFKQPKKSPRELTSLPLPHVTLPEKHRYTFSIVLKSSNSVRKDLLKKHKIIPPECSANLKNLVREMHKKCIRRLVNAGLGVVLLENNSDTSEEICILIDPHKNRDLLVHEFKRERDEIAIRQGKASSRIGITTVDDVKKLCFSPALELQLTHNIIRNAFLDYDRNEWEPFDGTLNVWDVISYCFPLHDQQFNKRFFDEYRKRTFDFSMAKATTGNSERWAIEELRLHFGERVAFLFAFMHVYNKLLLLITIPSVLYYIVFRFIPGEIWKEYMRGLSILGFGVASIWAPSLLIFWERETRLLTEKWNLSQYKDTAYERNDENPNFQYVWAKSEITGEMEKRPKSRKRIIIRNSMAIFVLLSAVLQCMFLIPFIQWYVFAKQAPVCEACRTANDTNYVCIPFLTCFNSSSSKLGTDRWLYILIQGILLGLTIDILLWEIFNWLSALLVKWENYETKTEYENRLIHRRFLFVWSNWFFWFLFLAFVYLPFGDKINDVFAMAGLSWFSSFKWEPELLTLDTLFVTPLVVTQFLNLLLETVVPYLARKCRGRNIACSKGIACYSCFGNHRNTDLAEVYEDWEQRLKQSEMNASKLAESASAACNYFIPVLPRGDDSNQYNSTQILNEAKLSEFDPMNDYLDAMIQFSYVVMFTVVWPLLPFPAFFNNLLEVRGDAFRLLFAQRRPMPRRDQSIGEWVTVLRYCSAIGVIVVAAFIFVYHFGYWLTDACTSEFSESAFIPFSRIVNETKNAECADVDYTIVYQIVFFLLLEHFGLSIRHLVLQSEKTPHSIGTASYRRFKEIEKLTNLRSAHAEQFKFVHELRLVFDKYDLVKDDHLREEPLCRFLAEWFGKHPSEVLSRSSLIFRYMDKSRIGKIPFSTCALILQHVQHDRLLSNWLGLYSFVDEHRNEMLRLTEDALEFRRLQNTTIMSRESSLCSLLHLMNREDYNDDQFSTRDNILHSNYIEFSDQENNETDNGSLQTNNSDSV